MWGQFCTLTPLPLYFSDSFCYEIRTEDVYKDLSIWKQHLDCSYYPEQHPLFSTEFKKVPGQMKDELQGLYFFLIVLFLTYKTCLSRCLITFYK